MSVRSLLKGQEGYCSVCAVFRAKLATIKRNMYMSFKNETKGSIEDEQMG